MRFGPPFCGPAGVGGPCPLVRTISGLFAPAVGRWAPARCHPSCSPLLLVGGHRPGVIRPVRRCCWWVGTGLVSSALRPCFWWVGTSPLHPLCSPLLSAGGHRSGGIRSLRLCCSPVCTGAVSSALFAPAVGGEAAGSRHPVCSTSTLQWRSTGTKITPAGDPAGLDNEPAFGYSGNRIQSREVLPPCCASPVACPTPVLLWPSLALRVPSMPTEQKPTIVRLCPVPNQPLLIGRLRHLRSLSSIRV